MSIARTFRDLKEDTDLEQLSLLASMGISGAFGWAELLNSRRVLIVSEAGAGKTYECKAQRDRLWNAGEAAFYIDLASLKDNNLRDLLSREEEARLDAWLTAQSDIATFFLDSIDELELTLGKFETALKRFGRAIAGHVGRARIVITSRPIPIDQKIFREQLPIPPKADDRPAAQAFADVAMRREKKQPKTGDAPAEWRDVALMPLSDTQILEMARVQKVPDPEAMLADIRRRNAQEFARRPQDLIELCVDWRDNRRIRSHAEQVAHNIVIKLKPRPPSERPERAPLDEDKALEGASRLALAALLIRKLTIRHSAAANKAAASEVALDPAAILTNWSADEIATLLERPLFGFATYGRVRFHHRSVIEFLAAERLHDRLGAGMPVRAVKRLLFAETAQGPTVIKSAMKPVAAWLARRRDSVFAGVLDIEPSVLLDFGDPASLTIHQRADALRAYVKRYGQGGWRGLDAPDLQVHRFASPELAPEVRHLWVGGIENPEVRSLLLSLIGAGKMTDCAGIAHNQAISSVVGDNERLDAAEALIALDHTRLRDIAASIEANRGQWSNRLVRLLISRMFPRHMPADQLCRILGTLTPKRHNLSDLTIHLPYLVADSDLASSDVIQLRRCLSELVMEAVKWDAKLHDVVGSRDYLIPALTAACIREWRQGPVSPDLVRASMRALRLHKRNYDSDDRREELRALMVEASPADRELAFWAGDDFMQMVHPETDTWSRIDAVTHHGFDLDREKDWGWITAALADKKRPIIEREVMLHAAYWASHGNDWRHQIAALRPFLKDEPSLVASLDKRLEPAKRHAEYERMERDRAKRRKQEERRKAKAYASWVQFWQEIANKPDRLFSEEQGYNTAWNLWRVMERTGAQSRASGWNRRFIEGHFGKEVADRLRTTLMQVWRNDRPTLGSERKAEERSTYLVRWQLGVAALAAESEDARWAQKLTPEEAELAARYAPIELNGFPSWLESLAIDQSDAVDAVLGNELTLELSEPAIGEAHSMLLQNISYAPPALAKTFVGRLREWLDRAAGPIGHNEDPGRGAERLARVLDVLLKHGDEVTANDIGALAEDQLARGVSPDFARVWLPTLMRLSPRAGVERIEQVLAPLPVEPEGTAVGWFATLFGERHRTTPVSLTNPGFGPGLLLRLVRLAYRHVQHEHDIQHEGSYSPGMRDNAEDARNALLKALLATKGAEAWAAKLELAEDPLCAHIKDRLFALARERLAEEADEVVFDYPQVTALDRHGEAPPVTRDDMFALLRDRLDDIDDSLLQDTSPREGWAAYEDEKILRRAIAHELRHKSNDAYTVDQE